MISARLSEIFAAGPVIAVATIERVSDAVPLAAALRAGGIRVVEVTLRTPAGLAALEAIARGLPETLVGAGTVRSPADVRSACDAGAQFLVSPGFTAALHAAAQDAPVPWLPGVATASEILVARDGGHRLLKFFPAEAAGGAGALLAFAGVFPDVGVCPRGGVTAENAATYLALPNVRCVGGTWVAPRAVVARQEWQLVQSLASQAASLTRTA